MKVRFLISNTGVNHSYRKGEVVDMPVAEANTWINSGLAESYEPVPEFIPPVIQEDPPIIYPARETATQKVKSERRKK